MSREEWNTADIAAKLGVRKRRSSASLPAGANTGGRVMKLVHLILEGLLAWMLISMIAGLAWPRSEEGKRDVGHERQL